MRNFGYNCSKMAHCSLTLPTFQQTVAPSQGQQMKLCTQPYSGTIIWHWSGKQWRSIQYMSNKQKAPQFSLKWWRKWLSPFCWSIWHWYFWQWLQKSCQIFTVHPVQNEQKKAPCLILMKKTTVDTWWQNNWVNFLKLVQVGGTCLTRTFCSVGICEVDGDHHYWSYACWS